MSRSSSRGICGRRTGKDIAQELSRNDRTDMQVKQAEAELAEYKQQAKLIFRRLNQNSEPRASIESGPYTLQ